jgi:hypothetical protein
MLALQDGSRGAPMKSRPGSRDPVFSLIAAAFGGAISILALSAAPARAQMPDPKDLLANLGFAADAQAKVMAGELVNEDVKSSNERELATGLAFLVKQTPKQLVAKLEKGLLQHVDANTLSFGEIRPGGGLADFAGLKLAEEEIKAYQNASPGDDLNLSSAEIETFQSLSGKPASAIEAQVRQSLLARVEAYQKSGLDGIAPYARAGGERSAAADLRSASEASAGAKKVAPSFYQTLIGYPVKPEGFRERYTWTRYQAHGEPVLILTHAIVVEEGDAFAVCQRQFYVSASYNSEQAVAAFLPAQGGTLVVYANRTSTDAVTGFGGGTKRKIGAKVLASQLEGLFGKLQEAAQK